MKDEIRTKITAALDIPSAQKNMLPDITEAATGFSAASASDRRKILRPLFLDGFKNMLHGADLESMIHASGGVLERISVRSTISSIRDYTCDAALIALALGIQTEAQTILAYTDMDEAVRDNNEPSDYQCGLHISAWQAMCDVYGYGGRETSARAVAIKLLNDSVEVMGRPASGTGPTFTSLALHDLLAVYAVVAQTGSEHEVTLDYMKNLNGVDVAALTAAIGLIDISNGQGTEIEVPDVITPLVRQAVDAINAMTATGDPLAAVAIGPSYAVPPALSTALNAVMGAASLPTIETLIGEIDAGKRKASELEDRLSKLSTSTVSKAKLTIDPTAELPKGKTEWKNVLVVLKDLKLGIPANKEHLFNFEVPYFTWASPHRDVPPIDPDYRWRWDILSKVMWGLAFNKKPWIWGHTGTGKTTLIEQVCAILQWPFCRINFDSEITRMDLVGRDTLRTDEKGNTISFFQDGILPQAMTSPTVICNDELDFVRSDIAYVYQRALEDKGLLLTEDGGRLVQPHEYCRMVATANTQGQGDEFGLYQGARVQSQAFLDRFQCWVEIPYLTSASERKLIEAKVPSLDKGMVDKICKYVTEHREAFTQAAILKPISPRGVVSLSEAMAFFTQLNPSKESEGVRMALETTVLGSVTHADATKINELVDRTFN